MTQTLKKRTVNILLILLAFAVIACFVPQTGTPAFAEDSDPDAICFVADGTALNITGQQVSSVYFGNYKQSSDGNGDFNVDPIKWRVLSNADGRLFLLADQNLESMRYNMITYQVPVTWTTCTMRAWLNGGVTNGGADGGNYDYTNDNFIKEAFVSKEKAAIATTTVVNEPNPDSGISGGDNTSDQIFLLSIGEINNTNFGFTDKNSRSVTDTAYVLNEMGSSINGQRNYWLRSPGLYDWSAAYVSNSGVIDNGGVFCYGSHFGVRPALNINLKSVLFTSAAASSQSAGEGTDPLTQIGTNTTDEWKLTLKDDGSEDAVGDGHQGFKVDSVTNCDGKTLNIKYSRAATGNNEFVSAVIKGSDGKIKYYGRIKNCADASDTVDINISGKLESGDKLYLFNEQYNEDKKTGYASALNEVSVPAHKETTVTTKATITKNGSVVKKCSVCGKEFSRTTIYYPKTFKLSAKSYTYNGKAKKPSVTVTDANGKTIASSNYSVAYSNNVKAGKTATVKITFKGSRYSGIKTLTFTINKAANPLTIKARTAAVKYSALKKKTQVLAVTKVITFTKKGQGTITYTKASGSKSITINKKTGKVTIKKGLKKGSYKVKVKVKAAGNANYKASALKTITFTINVK